MQKLLLQTLDSSNVEINNKNSFTKSFLLGIVRRESIEINCFYRIIKVPGLPDLDISPRKTSCIRPIAKGWRTLTVPVIVAIQRYYNHQR